jgi:hypothetical protein
MSELSDASVAPLPPPTARPGWVKRFIVDYNPFFLLSAMSMLGGSLALTNSLSWSPVRLERILLLTVAINLYELLLVALGLFLIVRRNARRDGSILLILEAFFLVDVAFLNSELFTIAPWVGLAANLVVFTLVLAKLGVIFAVLRTPFSSPLVGVIVLELLALFALPGLLKMEATISGGRLTPLMMYMVWWAVFIVGVVAIGSMRSYAAQGKLIWFAPLVSLLACVSLIAHAATSQWVYDLHYWGANLAPMLALGAFLLLPSAITRPAGFLCAAAAIFASLSHNSTLNLVVWGRAVSPIDLTALAIYLVVGWTLMRGIFLWICGFGVVAGLFAVFGPSLATVKLWAELVFDRCVAIADALRPKTLTHWGIIGVVMSFVFLVIGAVISLRREPLAEDSHSAV